MNNELTVLYIQILDKSWGGWGGILKRLTYYTSLTLNDTYHQRIEEKRGVTAYNHAT